MKVIFVTDCEIEVHESEESSTTDTISVGDVREFTVIDHPLKFDGHSFVTDPDTVNVQFDDGSVAFGLSLAWFTEATDLKRGDKVYSVWNGKLETAVFLEESVVDGAWRPTWLIRKDRKRFRCSPNQYLPSAEAASKRYLQECKQAVVDIGKHLEEVKQTFAFAESEVNRVEGLLKSDARRLAEAYYALNPGELPDNPDWADLERVFGNWLERLHKEPAKALATINWAGKVTAAYFSMLGKSLPKTKREMLEVIGEVKC